MKKLILILIIGVVVYGCYAFLYTKPDNEIQYVNFSEEDNMVHYPAQDSIPVLGGNVRALSVAPQIPIDSNSNITGQWYEVRITSSDIPYYVIRDDGPSGDPHLKWYTQEQDAYTYRGSTPVGVEIKNDGLLYVKNRINEIAPISRIYQKVTSGSDIHNIVEVEQDLYPIDIRSRAQLSFVLQTDNGSTYTVPVGTPLYVKGVSNTGSYLANPKIRVETDVVQGWVDATLFYEQCSNLESFISDKTPIAELCFAGD